MKTLDQLYCYAICPDFPFIIANIALNQKSHTIPIIIRDFKLWKRCFCVTVSENIRQSLNFSRNMPITLKSMCSVVISLEETSRDLQQMFLK